LEQVINVSDIDSPLQEPRTGLTFTPETYLLSKQDQDRKLAACGIDGAVFGGFVDAAFYIGAGIHVGISSGISAEGNVNMLQRLIQHRRVELGEELTGKGYIKAVTEVPRGLAIDTEVWFEGEDGHRAISAPRRSLKPHPKKAGLKGAGQRPLPVIDDLSVLSHEADYKLTPAAVKAYSQEGNSIHYEMKAANSAGFRAPIIGGGMGVHFLTSALWRRFAPVSFNLDIYFRRPIFWDDPVSVKYDSAGEASWTAMCLCKDNKVLTEARIEDLDW
jgi:hypothetical protein